jgi:hypothetical protein
MRFNPESSRGMVIRAAFYKFLRNSDGKLYVRYLNWNGDRWNWNDNWLDNDFDDQNPAAVRNYFISLPEFYRKSFAS